ncbi:MAG: divalent metal cation transporter, partial [Rhodospirillaceae bacterium]|nr:divalent metal cation transporter [Rhodospirillaceae bacterium]
MPNTNAARRRRGSRSPRASSAASGAIQSSTGSGVNSIFASIRQRLSLKGLFKRLGPGVITGAADDDPSGIATYSQAGAQFGFALLWTVVLTWPLMVAVQSVSARIGRVTGHG